ncbi:hypothetical protein ACFY20_19495 [Streptomyces sp. NPDC001312]|uniref:hypothetical protein n=1 Tax=Streptomyces sp. NPDC001312 TaxID=3364561 RepID=UPI0036A924D3
MPPDPAGGQPVRGADEPGEVETFAGDAVELVCEVGAGPPVRPRAHGFNGGLADAVLLAEGEVLVLQASLDRSAHGADQVARAGGLLVGREERRCGGADGAEDAL